LSTGEKEQGGKEHAVALSLKTRAVFESASIQRGLSAEGKRARKGGTEGKNESAEGIQGG